MKKNIIIEGMGCQHCVDAVTAELTKIAGVGPVSVDLDAKTATVEVAPEVSDDALRDAIEDAGYDFVSVAVA